MAGRLAIAVCTLLAASAARAENYLITFGDSYSQTGFDVTKTKPSGSNVLGNPSFPGWTTSGGPNWLGFLAQNHSLLTYNFADGGATTDATLVTPFQPTVKSFIDQVKGFSNSIGSHPSYAPWTSNNTVFGVWIGVNDVGNSWWKSDVDQLNAKIMDKYFEQLQILYTAGARVFALLGVPPIQRSPTMLQQTKDAQQGEFEVIKRYNALLASRWSAFMAKNTGVMGAVVDTIEPFNAVLDKAKDPACYNSDGVTCAWWNDYHPGIAIHETVAKAVERSLKPTLRWMR
ncbi:carbohydrate esterase family 16 protein [Patellaria atrata CBS 101060]|uniref:Carbohydrate esterase family 16 protein n=1 Tax=Patellaria atrata CBS 101060 TaxID=1346257 RepID=A0A9P4VTG9_9PEZI|nr:carbohydrate esterase family 16 protein [Patellaria atrata CBS 101060]